MRRHTRYALATPMCERATRAARAAAPRHHRLNSTHRRTARPSHTAMSARSSASRRHRSTRETANACCACSRSRACASRVRRRRATIRCHRRMAVAFARSADDARAAAAAAWSASRGWPCCTRHRTNSSRAWMLRSSASCLVMRCRFRRAARFAAVSLACQRTMAESTDERLWCRRARERSNRARHDSMRKPSMPRISGVTRWNLDARAMSRFRVKAFSASWRILSNAACATLRRPD